MYNVTNSTKLSISDIITKAKDSHVVFNSLLNNPIVNDTTNYGHPDKLSTGYTNYLTQKDGEPSTDISSSNLVLFVFGYEYRQYMLNKFQDNGGLYGYLNNIASSGMNIENSSFALVPEDGMYLGDSVGGFSNYTVTISQNFGNDKTWAPYMHSVYNTSVQTLFDNGGKWGVNPTIDEIGMLGTLTAGYTSGLNIEKFTTIFEKSTNVDSSPDDPTAVITPEGEDSTSTKMANSVIEAMYKLVVNVGSSLISINTSKIGRAHV